MVTPSRRALWLAAALALAGCPPGPTPAPPSPAPTTPPTPAAAEPAGPAAGGAPAATDPPARSDPTSPPAPAPATLAHREGGHELPDGSSLAMVWIGPGRFRLREGSSAEDVTIERGYWLATHELTWGQYRTFCRIVDRQPPTPSHQVTDEHPVHNVSWEDARDYCRWAGLRLPSEAEWEYACRAGSTTAYCYGDDAGRLDEYAWYDANSGGTSHPVGQKRANAWGLHDMHGNLWEWVEDLCPDSSLRVHRGGGWQDVARTCRSAFRVGLDPSTGSMMVGFRPAR